MLIVASHVPALLLSFDSLYASGIIVSVAPSGPIFCGLSKFAGGGDDGKLSAVTSGSTYKDGYQIVHFSGLSCLTTCSSHLFSYSEFCHVCKAPCPGKSHRLLTLPSIP